MSRCLSRCAIDHVLLERGEVASSWRGRWDSCGCSRPTGRAACPAIATTGDDPDGFMTMPEVIRFLSGYATTIEAPVETNTDGDLGARHRRRLHGRHDRR